MAELAPMCQLWTDLPKKCGSSSSRVGANVPTDLLYKCSSTVVPIAELETTCQYCINHLTLEVVVIVVVATTLPELVAVGNGNLEESSFLGVLIAVKGGARVIS